MSCNKFKFRMAHYEPPYRIDGVLWPIDDTVEFSDDMIKYAEERATEVVKAARKNGYNLNWAGTMMGMLGQGAVTYYLTQDWRAGVDQMGLGVPDGGFDVEWRDFKLEAKTFSWDRQKPPHTWMLVPLSQFYKSMPDAYVAVQRVKYNTFVILGVISRDKFENVGVLVGPEFDPPETEPEYHENDAALTSLAMLTRVNSFKTMVELGTKKSEVLSQI